jgi:hypothetical protein
MSRVDQDLDGVHVGGARCNVEGVIDLVATSRASDAEGLLVVSHLFLGAWVVICNITLACAIDVFCEDCVHCFGAKETVEFFLLCELPILSVGTEFRGAVS